MTEPEPPDEPDDDVGDAEPEPLDPALVLNPLLTSLSSLSPALLQGRRARR